MTVKRSSALVLVLVLLCGASAKGVRPSKPFFPLPVPPTCPRGEVRCW